MFYANIFGYKSSNIEKYEIQQNIVWDVKILPVIIENYNGFDKRILKMIKFMMHVAKQDQYWYKN